MAQASCEPVNLLSLDGGGIRGVSELLILDEIMRRIKIDQRLSETPRPCDYFDLIGGTSTGGLIALMLGRLRMTTDEALRTYNSLSEEIFSKENKKTKFQDGSFKATTLQVKVQEIVEDQALKGLILDPPLMIDPSFERDPSKKGKAFVCAVPANNMEHPRLFRTYPVRKNESPNCQIWEAARATTAAPTIFKRIAIGEEGHAKEEFIDGGLGHNNPVNLVLREAKEIFGDKRPVRCLLSIGTGHPGINGLAKPNAFQRFLPTGLIEVVKRIALSCEDTHIKLKNNFQAPGIYFRLNVARGAEDISLEEWEKIPLLTTHTKSYIEDVNEDIDKVVAAMCQQTGPTWTPGKAYCVPQKPSVSKVPGLVPFERNLQFVGRRSHLDQLENSLFGKRSPPKTAIYGLGGMGKTQIALELVYRTMETHTDCSVFWIQATNVETIQQAFTNICLELELFELKVNPDEAQGLLQHHLSQERAGKWLLIVDNIDDMNIWKTVLRDNLPRSRTGCIVCTTRNRKVAIEISASNVIEVNEMDEETAMELLRKLLPNLDLAELRKDVQHFLEQLTFMPLAIVQAAAYIKKNGTTLSKYSSLMNEQEQETIKLLSEGFQDDSRYHDINNDSNPVATTWLISFDEIQRLDPLAANYLSFISCLAQKNIPESFFPLEGSLTEQENAIGTLNAYSFISRRADRVFDVHRLVQLAMRIWLRRENKWQHWVGLTLQRLLCFLPLKGGHQGKEVWAAYLPHAIHVVGLTELSDTTNRISLLERIAFCEACLWNHSSSEWAYRQLLDQRLQLDADMDLPTLIIKRKLGFSLRCQGNYNEAEYQIQGALAGFRKKLGPKHLATLRCLSDLGSVLLEQKRYGEAEELSRKALKAQVKLLRPEHPDIFASVFILVQILERQGKYEDAEAMGRRALRGFMETLGPNDESTLHTARLLAIVLERQCKYEEAARIIREVKLGLDGVLGPEDSAALINAGILGPLLPHQSKYEEAIDIGRRALKKLKMVLGPEQVDTLQSADDLEFKLSRQDKERKIGAIH
ncbi:FabD/lysophospholipase-like protein [Aaosphaeria arxii CBS 175.79]|uniref:FabD/lysophospholipase-like protein n=1 Tax=Aaosphaeria arxii CBS 175.79 TaxID=1450172 RepID=A0A6A5XLK0_9PLEO|nr:FabD/lysophospholipase-like protein [Aaosphaeria arxii CBS 175.79]KAF2014032.1 FabD/lysophospholipase-like protein [Aaosphaeria arxii CBS 175.79]